MCDMWQTKITMKAGNKSVQKPRALKIVRAIAPPSTPPKDNIDPWSTPREKATYARPWKGSPMIHNKPKKMKENKQVASKEVNPYGGDQIKNPVMYQQ